MNMLKMEGERTKKKIFIKVKGNLKRESSSIKESLALNLFLIFGANLLRCKTHFTFLVASHCV